MPLTQSVTPWTVQVTVEADVLSQRGKAVLVADNPEQLWIAVRAGLLLPYPVVVTVCRVEETAA